MLNPSNMNGKVALVTGAAAGLGKATALTLARAGANLCIVDINPEALEQTASEIRALGVEVLVQAVNLASADNCRSAVAAAIKHFGRLDALCNVAAVFMPTHSTEMSDEDWNTTLAVNLSAPFHLIQAAIPQLLEHHGAVVNVTSCAAHMGQAYLAAYSSTKAALTHLTKSLAMEYMHQPIRFNAVAPGGMMTALAAGLRELPNPDTSLLSRISPLRGLVEIDDVAQMVAFLATDAARGYHGAVINIDNGITAG
ncbi:SDR family oxidoreductase [Aestuariicella hydrocarbonica]|uniref:SDR family oxidoreductase n=1 Tax=Pseudomaricurvus hydrocarbonicus TaxID=1470433 RepID=A0A9E5JWX5_9GAMM|nr:SDR family oxidoreductase [Aestuariicella hydrocarbonica]NHO66000.1 SDR family oxidoreductase [Aestuariicella hydrocarbonica]